MKKLKCFETLINPKRILLDYVNVSLSQTNLKFNNSKFYAKPIISNFTGLISNHHAAYIGSYDFSKCFYPRPCLLQKLNSYEKMTVYYGQSKLLGLKYVNILVAKLGYKQ